MAKIVPAYPEGYEFPADDIVATLGPPPELFQRATSKFVIEIDEVLWPGHKPFTAQQIQSMLLREANPRSPHISVVEVDHE